MRTVEKESEMVVSPIIAVAALAQTGLSPIIKWAGGKERELPRIFECAPQHYNRFFDPFVGGGSVLMAFPVDGGHLVNDKSEELIALYRSIQNQDPKMFEALERINLSWKKTSAFVDNHPELQGVYTKYRDGVESQEATQMKLYEFIGNEFTNLISYLGNGPVATNLYEKELQRNITQKYWRMKKIETKRTRMPEKDLRDNIQTAVMGSLYMYYRSLYNGAIPVDDGMKTALFVFIRNFAYSGMFRYNGLGEFNVPYGGIGYNAKTLDKKIAYYRSELVARHLSRTTIECLDFEEFLRKHPPQKDDFVFLDPPYDSEFSTYAKNAFGKEDQRRLANYLINECKGKWLMVIKCTPFIYSLYDGHGLNIRSFDKKYQVSFMNRNNRDVRHLIITNY